MHEHHVGFDLSEHVAHAQEHTASHVVEILSWLHNIQIVIRGDAEYLKHLVKHLAMLACHADTCLERIVFFKFQHEWSHLDSFGSCAENKHYFSFHNKAF